MIRINKVTTKTGDGGLTLGPNMKKMLKNSSSINFIGRLDELNCYVGQAVLATNCNLAFWKFYKNYKIRSILTELQNQLFDIGAIFFKQTDRTFIKYEKSEAQILIQFLEQNIKTYTKNTKTLDSFLLPQGNKLTVALHIARSQARAAERDFWKTWNEMKKEKKISNEKLENLKDIGIYLNRFSDLLFSIARKQGSNNAKWIVFKNRKIDIDLESKQNI